VYQKWLTVYRKRLTVYRKRLTAYRKRLGYAGNGFRYAENGSRYTGKRGMVVHDLALVKPRHFHHRNELFLLTIR
jgi:hypothetical protein